MAVAVAMTVLWMVIATARANATGDLRYQSPRERALGVSSVINGFVFDRPSRSRWIVESGQRHLFGIPGLKTTFLRWGVDRGSTGLLLSAAVLSTPVGGEKFVAVEPFYSRPGRFLLGAGAAVSITSVHGYRDVRLVTVGLRLAAVVSDGVALGYRLEEIRAAGRGRPGGDMALYLVAWRNLPVSVVVNLQMDRNGEPGVSVASRVELGRSLEISVGYDDRTGALRSSLAVRRRALVLTAGADHHPVLGLSKAFFVRWRWGR